MQTLQCLSSETYNLLEPKEFGQLHLSCPVTHNTQLVLETQAGSTLHFPLSLVVTPHSWHLQMLRCPQQQRLPLLSSLHGLKTLLQSANLNFSPQQFQAWVGPPLQPKLHLPQWPPGFSVGIPTFPNSAKPHLLSMIPLCLPTQYHVGDLLPITNCS